ncbi:hypothetical protein XAB3213_1840021 [Xanthomonas citri pv. bilvae]|nr:hypothetical protein XAB3213_1840021 [Xanthomonas citri pv. bilvae]
MISIGKFISYRYCHCSVTRQGFIQINFSNPMESPPVNWQIMINWIHFFIIHINMDSWHFFG